MSADPSMSTEAAVAGLVEQVKALGREIGQMRREIADKLGDLAQDVADTKAQAKITNGRVTAAQYQGKQAGSRVEPLTLIAGWTLRGCLTGSTASTWVHSSSVPQVLRLHPIELRP